MTGWLVETLVWTGALIAAVLVLRRSVAHWFGPQLAYALWAVPALRLVLPPLELPAWMNSAPAAVPAEMVTATTPAPAPAQAQIPLTDTAPNAASAFVPPEAGFDWAIVAEIALAVWLIGAAVFLYLRFAAYFRLRAELLADAREVGREGKVRLIDTPGTRAPLAFGVIDKVIALPRGFLALPDRRARDLALAHELAHHAGRDLLVNVLVQPLFALHWWNPLSRYGWLALRRDQEAACDARVMASRPPEERPEARAVYADLIVSFAAGPNIALAHGITAPMACPVLGEKSIIHRLRSLKMNDTPNSRRLAGRIMLGAAVVALPLTASITYAAATDAPEPPASPAISDAPPVPPVPPVPPIPPVPDAPDGEVEEEIIIKIDPNGEITTSSTGSENVFVLRRDDGQGRVTERRWVRRGAEGAQLDEQEIDAMMAEMRASLAETQAELDRLPEMIEEALKETERLHPRGRRAVVEMGCDNSSVEPTTTSERADGTQVVKICRTRIMAQATDGLREAREEVARNREMDAVMRERVVRELDRQIAQMERSAR